MYMCVVVGRSAAGPPSAMSYRITTATPNSCKLHNMHAKQGCCKHHMTSLAAEQLPSNKHCYPPRHTPPAPLPRYYRCVCAVETRFPISKEKGAANVSFAWFDAFRPSRRAAQHNIHFEKSSVLFNMASLASQQGLQSDRTSAEGLTQACKLFQVEKGLLP